LDATPKGKENGGSLGNTKVIREGRGMGDKGQGVGKGLFLGSTHKLSRDGGGRGQGKKNDGGRDFGSRVGLWGVARLGDRRGLVN